MIAQTVFYIVSLAPELSRKPGSGRAEVGQGGADVGGLDPGVGFPQRAGLRFHHQQAAFEIRAHLAQGGGKDQRLVGQPSGLSHNRNVVGLRLHGFACHTLIAPVTCPVFSWGDYRGICNFAKGGIWAGSEGLK